MAKGLRRTIVKGKAEWTLGDYVLLRADTELCEMAYLKGQSDMRKSVNDILNELGGRVDKMEATIRGK
jgi:hypothetical protein